LKYLVASILVTFIVEKKVPKAIDNATKGIVRFIGSARTKFLRSDDTASYIKFTLSNPLKTSSVNRVQKRINLEDPERPSTIMKKLDHKPTQA
jgi:hypothetical protein